MPVKLALLAAASALLAALALRGGAPELEAGGPRAARAATVIWAVGDGADGGGRSLRLARHLRAQRPERFIYLGDVYQRGTAAEFRHGYDAAYGALARRTDPAIGNHEFARRARGYFPYWRRER